MIAINSFRCWGSRLPRLCGAALAAAVLTLTGCDNLDPFQAPSTIGPAAPVSLVAVPASATSIGLSWASAPGDTAAVEYRLWRDGVPLVTVPGSNHVDGGLTPTTTYTYWVMAIDRDGHASSSSLPAMATTLSAGQVDDTPPTTPMSLVAVAASSSAIMLDWDPSSDAVGVLGYRIYRGAVEIAQAAGTSYSDAGLTASTTYTYTVRAFDAAGNLSEPSNAASATTLAQGSSDTQAPTAPGTLTATATSSTTASLSWSAATDDTGVLGYRVFRNGAQVGTSSGTSFADVGLTPSTSYSYTVVAYDAAGNSSGTSPSAIVTTPAGSQPDTQAPTSPATLTAIPSGSTTVDLAWSAASDNVGVTGYRVMRNGAQVATAAGTTYIDVGLAPATTYTYTVVAYDAANNVSSPSAPASATTQAVGGGDAQAPTAPTALSAAAAGPTAVDLSWTASSDNVGVTGYRIFRNGTQAGTTTGVTFSDTGLSPSTVYTYSVVAFDAAGNTSAPSGSASATTPAPPDVQAPSAPTGLTATAVSFSSIQLSWNPATDNVGVTEYRVFRNGVVVGSSTGTAYTDTGLSALTTYTYTVRAVDAAGNLSPHSSSVSKTTLPIL